MNDFPRTGKAIKAITRAAQVPSQEVSRFPATDPGPAQYDLWDDNPPSIVERNRGYEWMWAAAVAIVAAVGFVWGLNL